jgi:hypothetical protein
MSDRKTILIGLAVVVAGLLAGWWMWLGAGRYAVVTKDDGADYQVDTRTGEMWVLAPTAGSGRVKVPVRDPAVSRK